MKTVISVREGEDDSVGRIVLEKRILRATDSLVSGDQVILNLALARETPSSFFGFIIVIHNKLKRKDITLRLRNCSEKKMRCLDQVMRKLIQGLCEQQ